LSIIHMMNQGNCIKLAEIKNWRAELSVDRQRSKTDARGFPSTDRDQKLTRGAFRRPTEIKN